MTNATQNRWTPELRALWKRLEGFRLDDETAMRPFSRRLAEENGWTPVFAKRAIGEYRRFLFLAMAAGHPMTPSFVVDEVWHLHLIYTRSYWQTLCTEVLGRPLHHEPGAGGTGEDGKFFQQYRSTLESYAQFFEQPPPIDIWPAREEKPEVVKLPSRRLAWLRSLRPAHAFLMLATMLLAGCTSLMAGFDVKGPVFLGYYFLGFLVALGISFLLPWLQQPKIRPRTPPDVTDLCDMAFLGGGGRRLLDAALIGLHEKELIAFSTDGTQPAKVCALDNPLAASRLSEAEAAVLRRISKNKFVKVPDVREAAQGACNGVWRSLVAQGLVYDPAEQNRRRWKAALPIAVLGFAGVFKILVGLDRANPVLFLVLMVIATALVIWWRIRKLSVRTPMGNQVWGHCLSRSWATLQELRAPTKSPAEAPPVSQNTLMTSVALLGTTALIGTAWGGLARQLHSPQASRGSSCGSGCGSSCSSGGGCGSSCGGSGCGGCGGD
ncbi:MAG: TIGR04222 domain-containing membrane protein [Verrucomicrobiaceae bacterium]|nr:TIGR04222 domain-containing membrane protein [Verrucomicrobiaceae bacterium]